MELSIIRSETIPYLEKLIALHSPSGFTKAAETWLMDTLTQMGFAPERTHKGNVLCTLGGEGSPLLLAAHVDTLGAMVRAIKPDGRLRLTQIGGYAYNSIENENCTIHTRDGKTYTGTVYLTTPATHVHGSKVSNAKREEENVEVVLDENVSSAEDVKKLGITAGAYVCMEPRFTVTPSGYIKSRHLDDKASAAVLLTLAKHVKDGTIRLTRKVTILFTVYEEIGHGACAGLPEDTQDMVSVDMGCVGDDLTCTERTVSICVKDSRGPYDFDLTNALIAAAEQAAVPYALDVYPAYGSDADAALMSGHNFRHGLIGQGVFASHGYERTHEEGLAATYGLLKVFVTTKPQ